MLPSAQREAIHAAPLLVCFAASVLLTWPRFGVPDLGCLWVFTKISHLGWNTCRPSWVTASAPRAEAMKLHDEHLLGRHLAREYYWPGMYENLRKHIDSCAVCQSKRGLRMNKRPAIKTPSADRPFQKISMDYIGQCAVRGISTCLLAFCPFCTGLK